MHIFSTPLSRNSKERLEHTENHKKQVVKPWPCMFSQLFSPIKVKIVDKMMQSAYLCVILFVKYNKLALLAVLTWFLILGKKQNGDHCRWRHMPPVAPPPIKYIPHLVEKITKKLKGGVSSISLVPHGEGMNLRERPRVKLRRQLTKCKVPVSSSIDENSVAGQGET